MKPFSRILCTVDLSEHGKMLKLIPRKLLPQHPAHPFQILAGNLVIIGHHRIAGDLSLIHI